MDKVKIKRALISVFDKTGIEEFAAALAEMGVEIISSGGTAPSGTANFCCRVGSNNSSGESSGRTRRITV